MPILKSFFNHLVIKLKNDGRVKFSGGYDLEIIPNEKSGGSYLIADHDYMDGRFSVKEEAIIISFDS